MSLLSFIEPVSRKRLAIGVSGVTLVLLIGGGIMARNGWFPSTDAVTGQRTGWFGKKLAKDAPSSWNPLPIFTPTPTPTPQLSKEYIYAGSRLLAVEDKNASAVWPGDLAVWHVSEGDGTWNVKGGPGSTATTYAWGLAGDTPVPGDYDGDGKTDFAVYRSSNNNWYIVPSGGGSNITINLGTSGDVPAPADFDGDGKTDEAVFRSSNGNWYIYQSTTSSSITKSLGTTGDKVAPADYDGDGKADVAVWRYGGTSQFHVLQSSDGQTVTTDLGSASTNIPVSADYDGDGKADHSLLVGNVWTIKASSTGSTSTTTWQASGDLPVQNDYDGDGKVDIACYHPGAAPKSNSTWYIKQSTNGSTRTETFGKGGDIPVPAYYRR